MPGWGSILQRGNYIANNYSRLGMHALKGGFGNAAAGAMIGGMAGGAYGAMSSDTSVIGGAITGAGLGAGAGRYGPAGYLGYQAGGLKMGAKVAGNLAKMDARRSARGAIMYSNMALGRISSTLKGWGS